MTHNQKYWYHQMCNVKKMFSIAFDARFCEVSILSLTVANNALSSPDNSWKLFNTWPVKKSQNRVTHCSGRIFAVVMLSSNQVKYKKKTLLIQECWDFRFISFLLCHNWSSISNCIILTAVSCLLDLCLFNIFTKLELSQPYVVLELTCILVSFQLAILHHQRKFSCLFLLNGFFILLCNFSLFL